jgi:hypothetical protein
MTALKPISRDAIPRALEKAERYRMLNQSFFAESICLDVLLADPSHQKALAIYVLSLTDQFKGGSIGSAPKAKAALERFKGEFDRLYYGGIISERSAVALLEASRTGANDSAWLHLQDAMKAYEKADALQPDATNDDALLRYNTCVRLIETHRLSQPTEEKADYPLE